MKIPELQPLVDAVSPLRNNPEASDIYDYVVREASAAYTPSMGQTVCVHVIEQCHPRAWGDRVVPGFDRPIGKWQAFLGKLSATANTCGQKIFDNSGGRG